jgi:hypothetical protein
MKNEKIIKDLTKQFTLLKVDYYDNGEDKDTFVFYAKDLNQEQADKIWEEYDTGYTNDKIDCAFEEYLEQKGISYWRL